MLLAENWLYKMMCASSEYAQDILELDRNLVLSH